jgi:hypothetical protein
MKYSLERMGLRFLLYIPSLYLTTKSSDGGTDVWGRHIIK